MLILKIDIQNEVELITINDLFSGADVRLDIHGSENCQILINIPEADTKEVVIGLFELITHNLIRIEFAAKKFAVHIKNLVLKCAGIDYFGGVKVDNLKIVTTSPKVS